MKQFLVFFFSLSFIGCTYSSFLEKDFTINDKMMATVGSPIISWRIGKEQNRKKDGMKKELIFGGLSQNVLQFTYREYEIIEPMDTSARPAFYQDFKYDVPSDSIITFKGLIFKIHSFSGNKIEYTVIKEPSEVKNYKPSSGLTPMGIYATVNLAFLGGIIIWLVASNNLN